MKINLTCWIRSSFGTIDSFSWVASPAAPNCAADVFNLAPPISIDVGENRSHGSIMISSSPQTSWISEKQPFEMQNPAIFSAKTAILGRKSVILGRQSANLGRKSGIFRVFWIAHVTWMRSWFADFPRAWLTQYTYWKSWFLSEMVNFTLMLMNSVSKMMHFVCKMSESCCIYDAILGVKGAVRWLVSAGQVERGAAKSISFSTNELRVKNPWKTHRHPSTAQRVEPPLLPQIMQIWRGSATKHSIFKTQNPSF